MIALASRVITETGELVIRSGSYITGRVSVKSFWYGPFAGERNSPDIYSFSHQQYEKRYRNLPIGSTPKADVPCFGASHDVVRRAVCECLDRAGGLVTASGHETAAVDN